MTPLDPANQPLALPRVAAGLGDSGPHGQLAITGLPPLANADATANTAAALAGAPTLSGLMQALRRRWLLALSLAILGAAAAVAAVLAVVPARYVASARVQVLSRPERSPLSPGGEGTDFPIVKANMAALVKSPAVLEAVVKQDKIRDLSLIRAQDNPVDWLETTLKTEYLIRLSPEILSISLAGNDPDELALIVDAVTRAFLNENSKKESNRRKEMLEELQKNEREAINKLNQKRTALRSREASLGLKDPQTYLAEYQSAQSELSAARKEAFQNRLEQIRLQEEIKTAEDKLKNLNQWPVSDTELDIVLKQDIRGQTLEGELTKVEKDLQEIRRVAPPDNLDNLLRPKLNERRNLLKQLADLRVSLRPELEKKIRQDEKVRLDQAIQVVQEKLTALKRTEEAIAGEVQRREKEVTLLNPANRGRPPDVQAMQDEIDRAERALAKLGETIALLKVDPAMGSRLTPLQERVMPPTARDHGRQVKLAAAAGVGMFGFLLLGVALLEFRVRRISDADEVVQGLGLHLVGTLPRLPPGARRASNGTASTKTQILQNQLTEAVDSIRTLLLHAARTENLHTVMITSADGGEGKTSLAGQLASSLARAWRKTLLIDGDLRHPAGHKLFDVPQEPGFCEVLRGEVGLTDAVRPTPISRLWLLPAGHWDSHAVEALAQDGVKSLFEQLKTQYDFIIVDSCPVLPVADALLLGQHVDGVIFSILRDVSRVPNVHAAKQRLQNLGIRTLGAVVIGTPTATGSLAYKYVAGTTK